MASILLWWHVDLDPVLLRNILHRLSKYLFIIAICFLNIVLFLTRHLCVLGIAKRWMCISWNVI